MNNEENYTNETDLPVSGDEPIEPVQDTSGIEVDDSMEDDSMEDEINELEEDIIRNNTIPETSRDTPGSNGAFPVGAFDTSKD